MGNTIAKLVVIAAVAAVGFMGWQIYQRNQSGTTASASGAMDMEAAEALGREIGAQIGADIGRRVGEETVANLDMGASGSATADTGTPTEAPATTTETVAASEAVTTTEPTPATAAVEPPAPTPVEPAPAAVEPAPAPAEPTPAAAEPVATPAPAETAVAATEAPVAKPKPARKRIPAPPPCAASTASQWAVPSANSGVPIRYVGTASNDGKLGIVILSATAFSAGNNPGSAIQVATAKGDSVTAEWTVGGNPNMLFTTGLKAGCYKLTLGADLSNADGKKLGQELSGLVSVR